MKIGLIGLGRMGGNMATRLELKVHDVVGFDPSPAAREEAAAKGVEPVDSLENLVKALQPPRAIWCMVPAGSPTTSTLETLGGLLEAGDVIVEGGNSNFRETQDWAARLSKSGISLVDAGVSGGVWGLENGYCLMVGGPAEAVSLVEPVLTDLAPEKGWLHVGPSGAGHFVKMVHNGIEYGLMQSYAEGFELMASATELNLDLPAIAELWGKGSVVRSWLLELVILALAGDGFSEVKPWVDDSGEGRWTVEEGVRRAVPLPAITAALYERFGSRQQPVDGQPGSYAHRLLAALREQFGGHAVKRDPPV
ncbi:MAG TPA: decarboxylating 6-phosphogluconate dehydrogenase [Acidimicrobiales bacterium]|nr:decarboxylating 6-phosphogluconate dehydrogenase [Acidimicrobiales bacterium]